MKLNEAHLNVKTKERIGKMSGYLDGGMES